MGKLGKKLGKKTLLFTQQNFFLLNGKAGYFRLIAFFPAFLLGSRYPGSA
jgi:hypothetical protein